MPEPKKPEDHKQPATEPREVTVDGITVTVDPKVMNNWRTTKILRSLDDGAEGALHIVDLVEKVLGDDLPRVEDELEKANGDLTNDVMAEFLRKVLEAAAPNSSSSSAA